MEQAIAICKQHYKTDGCGNCPIQAVCCGRINTGRDGYYQWVGELKKAAKAAVDNWIRANKDG